MNRLVSFVSNYLATGSASRIHKTKGYYTHMSMLFTPKSIQADPQTYEKGVVFVTLLIHLPPASDDIAGNGRDARDVTDENISKAQLIYSIIASVFDESKKKRGSQPHFAFEVVGQAGVVNLYASVPADLVEVVKQAVITAYPATRLEEVKDYNIFNPSSGIDGVAAGEMELKDKHAFPIATYQDIRRDTMQALLNSLSNLQKNDGLAVQILIRPANDSWRQEAADIADKKRQGKYNNKKGYEIVAETLKQAAVALVKPPEEKKDEDKKDISGLEKSVVDAIEEKTRHVGFETAIRIVASSATKSQAEANLANVVASFSLYNAPGKNGFKFVKSTNTPEDVTGFIMRAFPADRTKMVLNAVELATLFHFPDQSNIPTSQLGRQQSKQVDGPRNIPEEGALLGYNVFRGIKKPIRISNADRQRHIYVVGQTGTGKSTFLEDLALQDMLAGNGFAFVDPHGDTAEKLLAMVPRERTEDVIYFCPAEMDFPMGLNLFEYHMDDQKDFLIQEALNMLYKLYDPQHQGIMGPRYEHLFRNAALTVMADPAGGTFVDIPKLFRDPAYVKQKLQHVTDPSVLEFWQKEMPQSQRSNEFGDVVSWFVSKFGAFLSNEMMRNIIGQTKSSFDLRDIMDNKKILLVNLSKGRTGELNSKLLGMVFVMKFQAAAMSRANIPEDERVDFSLYVDEFQNFSTDSFATIMSEARKFHLNLIVANQFTTQLTEEIRDAVFGNMGTIVAFRVGQNDVDMLAKYFQPAFGPDDLLRVPNYNTIVRTLIGGVPTQPFSMATLPPLGNLNPKLATALKRLSFAKYGHPKKTVEKEIFDRMKTLPVATASPAGAGRPGSPWSAGAAGSTASTVGASPAQAVPGKTSFLDDWLSKRKTKRPQSVPQSTAPPVLNSTAQPTKKPDNYLSLSQPLEPPKTPAMQPRNYDKPLEIGKHGKKIEPPHDYANQLVTKPAAATAVAEPIEAELPPPAAEKSKDEPPKPPEPAPADSQTLHLRSKSSISPQTVPSDEDTIAIDHEGNLIYKTDPDKDD